MSDLQLLTLKLILSGVLVSLSLSYGASMTDVNTWSSIRRKMLLSTLRTLTVLFTLIMAGSLIFTFF